MIVIYQWIASSHIVTAKLENDDTLQPETNLLGL
jgi:hypothetical protein